MAAAERAGQRRPWPQKLLISFNIVCIVAALGTAGVLGYINSKLGEVQRVSLDRVLTPEPTSADDPQNYLLVGTDNASGLAADDPAVQGRGNVGGERSDTIMILRIDPQSTQAQLLSVPRDLWVPIIDRNGNEQGKEKINAAIQFGGPEALIQTINHNFAIPIHHYVQIDWKGFKEVVAAIDGVPVYFDAPVRDLQTGFEVDAPGCVTLDPDAALAYVRSRYYQVQRDGEWVEDTTSDLGRGSRQQEFLRRALKRAIAKGARNPAVLDDLLEAGLDAVTVDAGLTPGQLLSIGERFNEFDPNRLQNLSLPVYEDTVGAAEVVFLEEEAAELVLGLFRGEEPDSVTPTEVDVQVLNGSGAPNQATEVSTALAGPGFNTMTPGDNLGYGSSVTLLRYAPGHQDDAVLVARYLEATTTLEEDPTMASGEADVVVTTGTDFSEVLAVPRERTAVAPTTTAPPTTVPTTDAPDSSTGDTDSPDELAGDGFTDTGPGGLTTLPGEVPQQPPDVRCG